MANFEQLDQEWIELMKEARDLGISIQEVKDYFQRNSAKLTEKEEALPTIRLLPS
ncbi:anti-repressor SinI family protein [Bacillus dakarensis]|uniref:anti-repressor SinI family protein n=1 Tax=Robertmurraya dakarensis TaxID=1926278 RepID=UPI000A05F3B0|nr:anti-repressor SinI family protein [Bacillus dakarensis]